MSGLSPGTEYHFELIVSYGARSDRFRWSTDIHDPAGRKAGGEHARGLRPAGNRSHAQWQSRSGGRRGSRILLRMGRRLQWSLRTHHQCGEPAIRRCRTPGLRDRDRPDARQRIPLPPRREKRIGIGPGRWPHIHGRLDPAGERTDQRTSRERTFTNVDPDGRQSYGHYLQLAVFWTTKDRTCSRPAVWVGQAGIHSARRSGARVSSRVPGRLWRPASDRAAHARAPLLRSASSCVPRCVRASSHSRCR